ncbi:MAG: peroxiredoxin, partial [Planctomycetes bacterium]|nr:peroxiredoxin [Planctomycetota bacterium]
MYQSQGLPTLNGPAPDFEAQTTQGPKKLTDYQGRWLVLFSHPADFTPVCTTEFVAFAKAFPSFQALNCDLLGLSIDSIYAHIAWVRDIEERFDVKVEFPVIADLSMDVAKKYGMIHAGAASTATVRCVFIIDPSQKVRALVDDPLRNARSTAEILGLVAGAQTT